MADRPDKDIADQLRSERDKWWARLLAWAKANAAWLIVSGIGYAGWLITLTAWRLS